MDDIDDKEEDTLFSVPLVCSIHIYMKITGLM